MTTKAIAPSEIAGKQMVKIGQTFDNIVQKINQKLIDGNGNTQFTFNADTESWLVGKVQDLYNEQGWSTTVQDSENGNYVLSIERPASDSPIKTSEGLVKYFNEKYPWAHVTVSHQNSNYLINVSGSPFSGIENEDNTNTSSERINVEVYVSGSDFESLAKKAIESVERCSSWIHSPLEVEDYVHRAFDSGIKAMSDAFEMFDGMGSKAVFAAEAAQKIRNNMPASLMESIFNESTKRLRLLRRLGNLK